MAKRYSVRSNLVALKLRPAMTCRSRLVAMIGARSSEPTPLRNSSNGTIAQSCVPFSLIGVDLLTTPPCSPVRQSRMRTGLSSGQIFDRYVAACPARVMYPSVLIGSRTRTPMSAKLARAHRKKTPNRRKAFLTAELSVGQHECPRHDGADDVRDCQDGERHVARVQVQDRRARNCDQLRADERNAQPRPLSQQLNEGISFGARAELRDTGGRQCAISKL